MCERTNNMVYRRHDYLGLLYGGGMRTLRQILHGCKKHHYLYFRDIQWFEDAHCIDGFKTKLVCEKCMHIENSNIDMMICRSKLEEVAYKRLERIKKLKKLTDRP